MGADGAGRQNPGSAGAVEETGLTICYVGLGSNLGDRSAHLQHAIRLLGAHARLRVTALSTILETEPVGGPPQGRYLNCVAEVQTDVAPDALLRLLKGIERAMGRPAQEERWGPRVIDLDLLLYGGQVVHGPSLTVPHPRLHERRFVLEPLAQLAPSFQHPVLHQPIAELLAGLSA